MSLLRRIIFVIYNYLSFFSLPLPSCPVNPHVFCIAVRESCHRRRLHVNHIRHPCPRHWPLEQLRHPRRSKGRVIERSIIQEKRPIFSQPPDQRRAPGSPVHPEDHRVGAWRALRLCEPVCVQGRAVRRRRAGPWAEKGAPPPSALRPAARQRRAPWAC